MLPTAQRIRKDRLLAAALVLLAAASILPLIWMATHRLPPRIFWFALSAGAGWWLYRRLTARWRRREAALATPFPPAWRQFLVQRIAFYARLGPDERRRFESLVAVFLAETPITGVETDVNDDVRLLVAASAIIPVFGLPNWEYDMLAEVLIYPHAFNANAAWEDAPEVTALGMVSTSGLCNGLMVLSLPDLEQGFAIHGDKHNVGIHEFAHLIDKATGAVDGVPAGLSPSSLRPWLLLLGDELQQRRVGRGDFPAYGFTSEVEFFAVASEYFFENPKELRQHHPELYRMLERIYHQDTGSRFAGMKRRLFSPWRRRHARNQPCPCGSGKKYKHCCARGPRPSG